LVVEWLYDFPHFFTPDLADEVRKSEFLIVKGTFVRLLMSYGEIMFCNRLNGKCQIKKYIALCIHRSKK